MAVRRRPSARRRVPPVKPKLPMTISPNLVKRSFGSSKGINSTINKAKVRLVPDKEHKIVYVFPQGSKFSIAIYNEYGNKLA